VPLEKPLAQPPIQEVRFNPTLVLHFFPEKNPTLPLPLPHRRPTAIHTAIAADGINFSLSSFAPSLS